MFCKVAGCRFSHTHCTKSHLCPKCEQFGHGQIECRNNYKQTNLIKYFNDELPIHLQCTVENCSNKKYHTTSAHHCSKCKERHPENQCTINNSMVLNIIDSNKDYIDNLLLNNNYTIFYAGMGCQVYVRKKNNIVDGIFMHSDSWGQYGPVTDETPRLLKFISNIGHMKILQNENIKCPLCRTININIESTFDNLPDDKCCVCLDSKANVKFNICNHICTCIKCYKILLVNS
jgi:hypothetical protein